MIPDISPRKHLRETTLLAYLRATGVLLGLGALLKVVGALQQAALAALYGAGPQLDAYFVAVALPNLLITFLIYGPLGLVFVPSFVSHRQTEDRPSIPSLVPSVLTGTAALGVVFVVVGYLGAPQIVRGLAPGFGPDTSSMAVQLFRLVLPAVGLAALNALFRGSFHAFQQFVVPTGAYVLSGLMFLGTLLALSRLVGVHAAPVGMVLGATVALLMQWWLLSRRGVSLGFGRPVWNRELGDLLRPLCLMGLALVAIQAVGLWARLYASGLGPGAVSLLDYGLGFDKVVGGLVAVSAATAAYPAMVAGAGRDGRLAPGQVGRGLRGVLLTTLPLTAILVAVREPLVRFWLERGRFTPEDSAVVSQLVMLLAPALIAWAFSYPLLYAFHALRRLRSPAMVAVVGTLVGAIAGLALKDLWGLEGITVAVSLSSCGTVLALFGLLTLEAPGLWSRKAVEFALKAVVATCVAALAASLYPRDVALLLGLGFGAAVAASAYFFCLLAFRVEEAVEVLRWAKCLLERRATAG